ncbi:MAG: hypothetical protein WCX71_01835 [Candidatus Buchananbacteria bacterium]
MIKLIKSISQKEWLFLLVVIGAVVVLTQAPFWFAYYNSTSDQSYNGLHSLTPADLPVYFSYIKQAGAGQIFFYDLFTTENQDYGTLNILWLLVGWLGRWLKFKPDQAYHLARLILAPGLLVTVYLFLAKVFSEIKYRQWGIIFAAFASGFGFFGIPIFADYYHQAAEVYFETFWPLDLWLAQTNIFSSIYHSPHLIGSWLCLVMIFLLVMQLFENKKIITTIALGLVSLVYFNFHPYYLPLVGGVIGLYALYWFIKNKKVDYKLLAELFLSGLIALPSVLYHGYLIINDAVIAQRAVQNVNSVFFFWPMIFGFGWLGPLAILGIYFLFKKRVWRDELVFVLIWLIVNVALIFLPTPLAQHYFLGWQIPLIIFSLVAIFEVLEVLNCQNNRNFMLLAKNYLIIIIIFVFFFCLTNVFNLTRDVYYFSQHYSYFYFNPDQVKAFAWLKQLPEPKKNILASQAMSLLLPAQTGQMVFAAHGQETLNYNSKRLMVDWFFGSNENDQQKKSWLLSQNFDYVYYSDWEKALGNFLPAQKSYLRPVLILPQVKIYQVLKD